jgi:hypothetical protein
VGGGIAPTLYFPIFKSMVKYLHIVIPRGGEGRREGNYEDYRYYRFNDLNDVFYFLDSNINIVFNDEWAMLNKQVNYRQSFKDYLQSHYRNSIVDYDKTDRGYEFDVYQF